MGLILVKIHRVLKFGQSAWLKKYIELHTELRKKATTDHSSNMHNAAINGIYGKFCESNRKKRDVKLVTKWEGRYGAKNYIAQPNFHSLTVHPDDNIVIIEMARKKVLFDKPLYIGFAILEISKTIIYDFFYNWIKKNFPGSLSSLNYMDTDSLITTIITPDIYQIIKMNLEKFDTSNFPPDNIYGIEQVNKKVLGLMKDENGGKIMTEFVGLRAKLYAFKVIDKIINNENEKINEKVTKRAKGVRRNILNEIKFENYMDCLFKHQNSKKCQHLIRNKKLNLYTISQNKLALSWADDKRVLLPETTDTHPWGYTIENK